MPQIFLTVDRTSLNTATLSPVSEGDRASLPSATRPMPCGGIAVIDPSRGLFCDRSPHPGCAEPGSQDTTQPHRRGGSIKAPASPYGQWGFSAASEADGAAAAVREQGPRQREGSPRELAAFGRKPVKRRHAQR